MEKVTRDWQNQYMVPLFCPPDFIPVKGQGCHVWDQEGREYIDISGGIAVNSLGHCNPELVKALTEQANKIWHVSNLHTSEPLLRLAKRITDATFADVAFFCNSGAEANEAALKLARRYALNHYGPEKDEIISFVKSFHGRTLFTVSVGGQDKYSKGFGPRPAEITHLPFNDIKALEEHISEKTCAVIMEPIQGESGIIPADREFMKKARELCDKYHALLVFDEVQTGNGRTGYLYAYMAYGVKPDIMTTAKGLAGGLPIGAMITRRTVGESFTPGVHGTTFGGNPLVCAVADKALSIINTKETLYGVKERSGLFFEGLNAIKERTGVFQLIRGMGLLIGCVLADRFAGHSGDFVRLGYKNGLFTLVAGPNVVRIAPSLNIHKEDIEEALKRFEKTAEEFRDQFGKED